MHLAFKQKNNSRNLKKHVFLLLLPMIVLLIGCQEINTQVRLTEDAPTIDTTYLAEVEAAQPKMVLIEEFTGVSCPPCPAGHNIVKSLKEQYPERLVVIANHIFNFPQASPVKGLSKQDFRTDDATEIGQSYGGVSFMPSAVFDRVKIDDEYLISVTKWAGVVGQQVAKTSSVNMHLSSEYNETTKKATVKVKLAYTKSFSSKHALTLAITESGIIDVQKNQTETDTFYTHNYVLRDIVTAISGTPIIDSLATKEAGRVIERVFEVAIREEWKPENCKIVAFIHANDGERKDVYQAAETSLKK